MSTEKQSRFYSNFDKLALGINTENVREIIFNDYKKLENRVTSLEYTNKNLEISLANKNKSISILEEKIKDLNTFEYYDIRQTIIKQVIEENETLKETNKNLLNIGKDMEEELNRYKEKYSKLKAKVNTIYGNSLVLGDISLEEASNLKKENEKLKLDKSELSLRVHYLEERICDNSLKSSEENQILKEENERLKQEKDYYYLLHFNSNIDVSKLKSENINLKYENERLSKNINDVREIIKDNFSNPTSDVFISILLNSH